MRLMSHRPLGQSTRSKPVQFGRAISEAELAQIRPLLRQAFQHIPGLGHPAADTVQIEHCSVLDAPPDDLLESKMPALQAEVIQDKTRVDQAIQNTKSTNGAGHRVISLQWVRFPTVQSDSLEISNPCTDTGCPVTKEGKPAVGRAILGKDMISWVIHD